MATRTRQSQRRTDALSRERIVEAAVELLDAAGETGLTVRALTERLATGPGTIYWHVGNRGGLLDAATDAVVAAALATEPAGAPDTPQDEIRAVALGLFDAIAAHPWLATQLATQLSRSPWGAVTPRIFESIGRRVQALGVPEGHWFTATSALVHYILGAAGQNAANARVLGSEADRAEFLDAASKAWEELDPDDYPFIRAVADQVREHDDREQFLGGIDLILTGVTTLHLPAHDPGEPGRRPSPEIRPGAAGGSGTSAAGPRRPRS
ncbi:TetR family transcriptional regulator [Sphaerisporangium siamense]|uniref:AcrR family transcriptional regulator n=1 Tax=Sphaerisporangium siamense TaxID=795645 RepID=A0A7W7DFX7_9ACTN|nr:TetR/AcrR family transcriptional regulator C-terminal domain-containing protein [Sphaerisporangium siamense]MBB4705260.1 AcrR family transcriptional regulator [Sphaerisporangium siamense]GII86588.1 TetR family transcriptional regulator [Sphaerisporangium siamense]